MLGLTNVKGTEQEFEVTNGQLAQYKALSGEIGANNFVELTQKVNTTESITFTTDNYNFFSDTEIKNNLYFVQLDGSRYTYQELFGSDNQFGLMIMPGLDYYEYIDNKYYTDIRIDVYSNYTGRCESKWLGILLVDYQDSGLSVIRALVFSFCSNSTNSGAPIFVDMTTSLLYRASTSIYISAPLIMTSGSSGSLVPTVFIYDYNPIWDTLQPYGSCYFQETVTFLPTPTDPNAYMSILIESMGNLINMTFIIRDQSDYGNLGQVCIFDTAINQFSPVCFTDERRDTFRMLDFIATGANRRLEQSAYLLITPVNSLNVSVAGYYYYDSYQKKFSLALTNSEISTSYSEPLLIKTYYTPPAKLIRDNSDQYYLCGLSELIDENKTNKLENPDPSLYYISPQRCCFWEDEFLLFCEGRDLNHSTFTCSYYFARYKIDNSQSPIRAAKIAEAYMNLSYLHDTGSIYGKRIVTKGFHDTNELKRHSLMKDSVSTQETVIKKADSSNSKILGITATTCGETTPGDVWILNT